MITKNQLKDVIDQYDKSNITIGVLGSHSALDVCHGAKKEGFSTLVVCQKGREKTYSQHYKSSGSIGIVDDVLVLDQFKDILRNDIQNKLREKNVLFIPHRSFQVYLEFDYPRIENEFLIPLFGSRGLLKAEERTQANNQYHLLKKANIRIPHIFKSYKDIDRLCLVKMPEKTRGYERSFFFCSSPEEFEKVIQEKINNNEIDEAKVNQAVIEEFILGSLVNFNYFYSPLNQRIELLGTDTRRQTNVDGLLRLTADNQQALPQSIKPKFEESGHIAVTVLESMLDKAFAIGDQFVVATKLEYAPGVIGPFALQSAIVPGPPRKDIVVFDVSLRVPGSPGTRFTPYTDYLYGMPMSTGRRIAMEIKEAINQNRLLEVLT